MIDMKRVVVSGEAGKDIHFRIRSVRELPQVFRKHLRKSIPYSAIPRYYGPEWTIERALGVLESLSIGKPTYGYGGRGPHVAYGIARLGGYVRLITVFGEDFDRPYPGFFDGGYWSHLTRAGVKMKACEVEVPDEVWGRADRLRSYLEERYAPQIYSADTLIVRGRETFTIVCCKDLEGIDFFYVDDRSGAGPIDIGRPAPVETIKESDIVFVTTAEPAFMREVVVEARKLGKEVVMDVGSYKVTRKFLREIIPLTDIIFGNTSELELVRQAFEVSTLEELPSATKTGLPRVVVVEDKIAGSLSLVTREGTERVGPVPLNKVGSSTGCCDGIAVGFLALYQRGFDLRTCAEAGLVVCSFIWEVEGVQEGMPSPRRFCQRFESLFGSEHSERELERLRRCLLARSELEAVTHA